MWFNRPKKRRNFFRKAQMAPYQARRFRNPYFRQTSKHYKWPFIITGLALGLTIALTSFFFTAPVFSITSVRVEGAESVNPKDIREIAENYLNSRALFIFKRTNRFLFSEKKLKEKLEKDYFFSSLEVKREGHSLAIILKEKNSSFLWLTAENSYLVDQTGQVIRATSTEEATTIMNPPLLYGVTKDANLMPELNKIFVFRDLAANSVVIGDSTLSENEVKNVRLFFETLTAAKLPIERFELNRDVGAWFKAVTSSGFYILFDPNSDVLKQTDSTLAILRDQIKDPAGLEYIDVRLGDHVYYK